MTLLFEVEAKSNGARAGMLQTGHGEVQTPVFMPVGTMAAVRAMTPRQLTDAFLTESFCRDHKLFAFDYDDKSNEYKLTSRDFKQIKERLLFQLTNFGQPFISVVNGNYENRGEILLKHNHEGTDLRHDYMRDTLANIHGMWTRPVVMRTEIDGTGMLIRFDGQTYHETEVEND